MAAQDRVRKVDVNKMEAEQVDVVAQQVGDKVKDICDDACIKANNILKIYGLQAKMQFLLEPLD